MLSNPNVAVFEVKDLGDDALTFTFVRGRGLGQAYGEKEPFGLVGPFMLRNGELLVRGAYAALKGLEDFTSNDSVDVILIEPESKDLIRAFSDHALGLIQTTAIGSCYPEFSPDLKDELVFLIDGVTHPMMGMLRPDDTLSVVSLGIPEIENRGKFGLCAGGLQVVALSPVPEGTFRMPKGTFREAELAYLEIGQDHPAQWLEDLQDLFWKHAAPTQHDRLVRRRSFGVQDSAFSADFAYGAGDENRMIELIDWALDLNENRERRRRAQVSSKFRMNRYAEVIVTASHPTEMGVAPATIATRNCIKPANTIIQEIVNWSWPRGTAPAGFKTNRASTAKLGGAKRRILSRGQEPSAHELIAAHAGLAQFLEMRKFLPSEIESLLALES